MAGWNLAAADQSRSAASKGRTIVAPHEHAIQIWRQSRSADRGLHLVRVEGPNTTPLASLLLGMPSRCPRTEYRTQRLLWDSPAGTGNTACRLRNMSR